MRQKHFQMGEIFVTHRPLAPLSTIYLKNASVEYELVDIFNKLLGVVGRGSGVGIRNCVVDLPPDYLNGVGGGIRLAEPLVIRKTVRICDEHVCCAEVGKHIKCGGSTVSNVRPVEDTNEFVLGGAHKLLAEGAVHILKHVEGDRCRAVCVSDGRCLRSGGVCRDYGRCARIGWGHDGYHQEGRI